MCLEDQNNLQSLIASMESMTAAMAKMIDVNQRLVIAVVELAAALTDDGGGDGFQDGAFDLSGKPIAR